MRNWPQTVVSQYTSAPRMMALLENIDEWISPDNDLEAFYRLIWNIRKEGGAQGYGLDVWGRIVGVRRNLTLYSCLYFGFKEADDRTGFNQATFWDGYPTKETYTLDDQTYRYLIFAKAAYNLTNASIPAINAIMMNLFPGRGNAYVIDGRNIGNLGYFGFQEAGDRVEFGQGPFWDISVRRAHTMTLTYVFDFELEMFEVAIVINSGVLPKPVGVKASAQFRTTSGPSPTPGPITTIPIIGV